MLSYDALLTLLGQSRSQLVTLIDDEYLTDIQMGALTKIANTIAEMSLLLDPMPLDPAAHVRAAHAWTLPHLLRLPSYDPTRLVSVGDYSYTPRKTLRRVLDHAIDHLNQLDQWLLWQTQGVVPTPTDGWVGSATTLEDDTLPITESDLQAWLWRINLVIELLATQAARLTEAQLDWKPPNEGWTLRQILHHVAWAERYYSVWLELNLPEDGPTRYQKARELFDARLYEFIVSSVPAMPANTALIYGEDLIYTPRQVMEAVLTAEQEVR
jgi:hypothetical protein